jgi:hypothetical protein
MDLQRKLADYGAARRDLDRAEQRVAELAVLLASASHAAYAAGFLLAERRRALAAHRLARAAVLADGRPLYQALWSLPDDL